MKEEKEEASSMKCKYCDYENPKEAVICECCGATLATQKSISYYKKEARKKVKKPKREKIKREKKRSHGRKEG